MLKAALGAVRSILTENKIDTMDLIQPEQIYINICYSHHTAKHTITQYQHNQT